MRDVPFDSPEINRVPLKLVQAVVYLNKLLLKDPVLITDLLDRALPCAHEDESGAIYRVDKDGTIALSALGILGGFVQAEPYLLVANWESDDGSGPISHFSIVSVEDP